MTVMAPEVIEGTAGRAAGGRAARGRSTRPPAARVRTTGRGSTVVSGSGGSRVSTSREGQRAMGRDRPQRRARREPTGFDRARRAAPTTKITRTNYQPVILAEFVAAVLLVAISPIATGKNKPGLSPYAGQDMIKLGAITVLYLILALLSVGGRSAGRMGAWFGGLILLTVGLAEAANLAKVLDLGGIGGSPPTDQVTGTTQTGDTIAGRN